MFKIKIPSKYEYKLRTCKGCQTVYKKRLERKVCPLLGTLSNPVKCNCCDICLDTCRKNIGLC